MTQKSTSDKLTELFELHKSGALSKDEYDLLKSEIINDRKGQELKEPKPIIEPSTKTVTNNENKNSDHKLDDSSLKKNNKRMTRRIVILAASFVLISAVATIILIKNSEWNESRATKKIMAELMTYPDWASKMRQDTCICYHHIIGFKQLSLSQKNVMVAITITNEEEISSDFGLCSIFEFDEKSRWKLSNNSIAFNYAYDIDSTVLNDNLHILSSENYGFEIEMGDGAAGTYYVSKDIYSFIHGKLKAVFSEKQAWQSRNYRGERVYELDFVDNGGRYFDIKSVSNNNPERRFGYTNTALYKFKGSEYVKER